MLDTLLVTLRGALYIKAVKGHVSMFTRLSIHMSILGELMGLAIVDSGDERTS
jgi:hypothetical protein